MSRSSWVFHCAGELLAYGSAGEIWSAEWGGDEVVVKIALPDDTMGDEDPMSSVLAAHRREANSYIHLFGCENTILT